MIYALIPIIFIAGIFIVFYLFKDKFMAKTIKDYDDANKAWAEDKNAVIAEMYENPNKLKMIKEAIGEEEIEAICPCEPKKSFGKKLFKGSIEVLTSRQTFDMSIYFFVVAGGELHYMQCNGEMVSKHDAFKLSNLRGVSIRPENMIVKTTNMFTANNAAEPSKESIFFTSNGKNYSFKLLDHFVGYAKFKVEKGSSSGKFGVNPFYRVYKTSETENTLLLSMYGPQAIATFREKMSKLQ